MAGEWVEETFFANLINEGALEIGDGYRARNEELGGDGPIFLRAGHVTDSHIDFMASNVSALNLSREFVRNSARPGDAVVTTKGNSTGRTTFVTPSMPRFVYSPHLSYWRSRDRDRIEGWFPTLLEQEAGVFGATRRDEGVDRHGAVPQPHRPEGASDLPAPNRRTTRHRPHPRHAGRQDRAEPADERDAGGDGAGALQVVVRGLRPRPRQGRRPRPRPPQPLADLFPDRLVDSELGEIPEGWAGRLDSGSGGRRPRRRTKESAYLGMQGRRVGHPKDLIRAFGSAYSIPRDGITELRRSSPDRLRILPKRNRSSSSRAPIGYLTSQKFRSRLTGLHRAARRKRRFTRSYAYCLARAPPFRRDREPR